MAMPALALVLLAKSAVDPPADVCAHTPKAFFEEPMTPKLAAPEVASDVPRTAAAPLAEVRP